MSREQLRTVRQARSLAELEQFIACCDLDDLKAVIYFTLKKRGESRLANIPICEVLPSVLQEEIFNYCSNLNIVKNVCSHWSRLVWRMRRRQCHRALSAIQLPEEPKGGRQVLRVIPQQEELGEDDDCNVYYELHNALRAKSSSRATVIILYPGDYHLHKNYHFWTDSHIVALLPVCLDVFVYVFSLSMSILALTQGSVQIFMHDCRWEPRECTLHLRHLSVAAAPCGHGTEFRTLIFVSRHGALDVEDCTLKQGLTTFVCTISSPIFGIYTLDIMYIHTLSNV